MNRVPAYWPDRETVRHDMPGEKPKAGWVNETDIESENIASP